MPRFILKQLGDAPKSLSHMAKFEDNSDLIFHLEELKKKWNKSEYGEIEFQIMEVVEGQEIAASAFFNGEDFMRNKEGKVVGFLNIEHKKEIDDDLGESTGEMGTLFIGVTEDDAQFKDIMLRPQIKETLKKIGFRGVFDINGCQSDQGYVAFEPTCRFGIPATSYEFIEGLTSPTYELIESVAKGLQKPISIREGVGMVMVVASKPFPVEADIEASATSIGEKLWILQNKKPVDDFTKDQQQHIHLENFYKDDTGYRVATKNGYLLTVTAHGKDIISTRNKLISYIKDNIYISGMKYRSDIGKKYEEMLY